MRAFFGVALGAVALLAAPPSARAIYELEGEGGELDLVGSARFVTSYMRFPDEPLIYPRRDDWLLADVFRLLADGTVGEHFSFELNLFAELARSPSSTSGAGGALATAGSFDSPYRSRYLTTDGRYGCATGDASECALTGELGLDRLQLRADFGSVNLTVGRFPLNYSVTSIFAPNDIFAPFSAAAVNRVYKPGVDAARIGVALGTFSSVELAYVLGSEPDPSVDPDGAPRWSHSALLLRAGTVAGDFEWSLLGGKAAGRWLVGASGQGQLGTFGVRAEGHVGFADANGDGSLDRRSERPGDPRIHGRLAAGFDRFFAWRNASVALEYYFASDGASEPSDYLSRAAGLFPDDQTWLGQHYLGASGGLEIIPILRAQGMVLLNAGDGSGLAALFLDYSAGDELELLGGALIPWGAGLHGSTPGSELGLAPVSGFFETRVHF